MMTPSQARRTIRGGTCTDSELSAAIQRLRGSTYLDDMHLVQEASVRLHSGKDAEIALPNGRTITHGQMQAMETSARMAQHFEAMNTEPLALRIGPWVLLALALIAAGLLIGTLPAAFAEARMTAETFWGY